MKSNRSRILLAILLVAICGGFAWQVLQPREPVYQGKPLSYWLKAYDDEPGPPEKRKADEAIRAIGTNSVPVLLRLLTEPDSRWWAQYNAFAHRHPALSLKISHATYWQRVDRACRGFEALGAGGSNAVPKLIELYQYFQFRMPPLASRVATILGNIGPPAKAAVPLLISATTTTAVAKRSDTMMRVNALGALASIRSEPDLVVPVFINALTDADPGCRMNAFSGLALLGRDARPAIPTLIKLLGDDNRDQRSYATNTLKEIDPEAIAKVGVK